MINREPLIERSRLIKRRRLTDDVADSIRDMIFTGELPPSKRFTQQELANIVGVSTMPIREALLRLSHEGLITATPNRSYEVTPTTRNDIRDIYWIYANVAGELTARACRNASASLIRELTAVKKSLEALPEDDVEGMEQINWDFHRLINRAGDSPRLMHMLRTTLRLLPERFYWMLPPKVRVSKHGHEQILVALKNADPEAGRAAAVAHVHEAGELIIAQMTDGGFWPSHSMPAQ